MTNALVSAPRLAPATADRIAVHIAKMMASMMAAKGGEFDSAVASDYVEAVRYCPEWAIAQVSEDFRFGRRGDGRFAPLPGEFGQAVNRLVDAERRKVSDRFAEDRQRAENEDRKAMLASRTDAQRERVRAAHERFKRSYEAHRATASDDAERQALRDDMNARMFARFDPETLTGGIDWSAK